MGILNSFMRIVRGDDDKQPTVQVSIGMGLGGSRDQSCKPGRFYVYVHKDASGKVFYVGKGTGDRAYSNDRPPEWKEYVAKSGGKHSVEIVREGISEDDALQIEDAVMAEHAATIINLQNMHAPYDSAKMRAYSGALQSYTKGLQRADELAKGGEIDNAIPEFEAAYSHYFEVTKNADYDLSARRGLASTEFNFHPHALADRYTKALAKVGRYAELVAFSERYFRDYGEPSNSAEKALQKRMENARRQVKGRV